MATRNCCPCCVKLSDITPFVLYDLKSASRHIWSQTVQYVHYGARSDETVDSRTQHSSLKMTNKSNTVKSGAPNAEHSVCQVNTSVTSLITTVRPMAAEQLHANRRKDRHNEANGCLPQLRQDARKLNGIHK